MMRFYISIGLVSIFTLLALIHFSWALGSTWGFKNALPKSEAGNYVLNPAPWESAVVGLGLTLFGLFYLTRADILPLTLQGWLLSVGSWVIPLIFLLRAIGDFKYVGFFKSITSTDFAWLDTIFYSPLCLILAVAGLVLLLRA
ncbi:MAG: DUF3995 domain-containing protein [Fulvivirga sp.]